MGEYDRGRECEAGKSEDQATHALSPSEAIVHTREMGIEAATGNPPVPAANHELCLAPLRTGVAPLPAVAA
jgi:hypothetical protein